MPIVTTKHRPLFSGLGIKSQRPAPPDEGTGETEAISGGTLTGVATRDSDDALVLVTNLHVLAGRDTVVSVGKKSYRLLNAAADESLYQGGKGCDVQDAERAVVETWMAGGRGIVTTSGPSGRNPTLSSSNLRLGLG